MSCTTWTALVIISKCTNVKPKSSIITWYLSSILLVVNLAVVTKTQFKQKVARKLAQFAQVEHLFILKN